MTGTGEYVMFLLVAICLYASLCEAGKKPPPFEIPPVGRRNSTRKLGRSDELQCGENARKNEINKIVGGDVAAKGEWPWQVFMIALSPSTGRRAWNCGGVLIADTWVVTAAHCTEGLVAEAIVLVLGEHDLKQEEGTEQMWSVATLLQHPAYDEETMVADISLLKLPEPVQFTDSILPVCLPVPGEVVDPGTKCWISGWGDTKSSTEPYYVLRDAEVPIVSNAICNQWYQESYGNWNYILDDHLCAGKEAGGVDTCQGDSGGPLVCANADGHFTLEGITSWGIGCADRKSPGVYTRVSTYYPWIAEKRESYQGDAEFYSWETTPCGTEVTTEQIVRLPVDPETGLYENNMNCKYTITPPDGHTTKITFVGRYSVEPSGNCEYDKLWVRKATGGMKKRIPCQFGLEGIPEVNLPGQLSMHFKSDSSDQFEGFAASIEFVSDCQDIKSETKCQKALDKGKCDKKGNKKKCKKTCGYCTVE